MASMEKLPTELTDKICDFLSNDPDSSKNLRLVARRFSRTAEHIFRTLVIYQHPDKWQNIKNIAQNSNLANFVHTIKLVREQCLPYYESFESFKQGTESFRHMLYDNDHIPTGISEALSASDVDIILTKAYTAYQYWRTGYKKMGEWHKQSLAGDPNGLALPQLHLNNLAQFHNLETIGHADLYILNGARQRYLQVADDITRQEAEALTPIRARQAEHEDEQHLDMFLLASRQSEKTISRLALHDVYEILAGPRLRLQFASLHALEIDLTRMARTNIRAVQRLNSLTLTFWAQSITSIETLFLSQDPRAEVGIDLVAILSGLFFPNLKTFGLKHIMTPEDTLRSFLQRHRDSLVSITVEEPLIMKRQWDGLRKAILDGADGEVFVPKEGTKLFLTDSYFEIHRGRHGPGEVVPRPPMGSNYWDWEF